MAMWCSTSSTVSSNSSRIWRIVVPSSSTSEWVRPAAGSSSSSSRGSSRERPRDLDALEGAVGEVRRPAGRRGARARAGRAARARRRSQSPLPSRRRRGAAARPRARRRRSASTHRPSRSRAPISAGKSARFWNVRPIPARATRCGAIVEQVPAVEPDRAALGRVHPAHAVEQRCLAGAVRADQRADLPGLDGEAEVVERTNAAELQYDAIDFQQSHMPPISELSRRYGPSVARSPVVGPGRPGSPARWTGTFAPRSPRAPRHEPAGPDPLLVPAPNPDRPNPDRRILIVGVVAPILGAWSTGGASSGASRSSPRAPSVSVDTIRFYQKRRLLDPPAPRRAHRLVRPRARRAAWPRIKELQRQGFTLAMIGRLLDGESRRRRCSRSRSRSPMPRRARSS